MVKDYTIRIHRIFGRSYEYDPVISANKTIRAHICGTFIAIDSSGEVRYIRTPREIPGTQQGLSTKHGMISYERFAEPQKGRLRNKPIVSLAMSSDGAWLACGEQGQAPLLCLWNLSSQIEHPRFVLNVHRFGIKLLAFSSDSRYLASIGYMHDAGIHIWDLHDECRMVFTNRVNAKIHDLKWIGENKIITCGVRHVRIWQFLPRQADYLRTHNATQTSIGVLEGRNVILGPLVHAEFTSVCLDRHSNVYLTTPHEICVYSSADVGSLRQIYHTKSAINKVVIKDDALAMRRIDGTSDLLPLMSNGKKYFRMEDMCKSQNFNNNLNGKIESEYIHDFEAPSQQANSILECMTSGQNIIAFTRNCEAIYYDTAGRILKRGTSLGNHVTAVAAISTELLVIGTTSGQIFLFDPVLHVESYKHVAHSSEVLFIKHDRATNLIASCGKDRTIQLFCLQKTETIDKLELYQTLDEHTSNVTDILFLANGQLVSCSSDRTVIIRFLANSEGGAQANHYVVHRRLDFRTACLSMTDIGHSTILCSFVDKSLIRIDICSGATHELCKTEDSYDKILASSAGIVACIASQDKAIAFRFATSGELILENTSGHTDRITSLRWYEEEDLEIAQTTSADGLVIQWLCDVHEDVDPKPSPVRKVIRKETSPLSPIKVNLRTPLRRSPSLNGRQTPTERSRTPSKLAFRAGSPSISDATLIAGVRSTAVDTRIMVTKTISQLEKLQQRILTSDQQKELKEAAKWLMNNE